MSSAASGPNVTVTLGGPIVDLAAAPATLRAPCEAALGDVARQLGVPFTADVAVQADQDGRRPVAVSVRGKPLDTPRYLDRQVLASRGAAVVTDRAGTPSPWEAARDAGADLLHAVVDIVEQTVVAQPGCLLGEAELDRWCADAGTARTTAIEATLRRVLDLRISVADKDTVRIAQTAATEPADIAEHAVEMLRPTALEIVIAPGHLEDIATGTVDEVGLMFPYLRETIYAELGVRMPDLRIVEDPAMPPRSFRFRINNLLTPLFVGFPRDMRLINTTPDALRDVSGTDISPSCVLDAGSAIIPAAAEQEVQRKRYTTWNPLGHLVLALADAVRQSAGAFVDQRVVSAELDMARSMHPELVSLAESVISVPRLTRLLRALVSEGISIRPLRDHLQNVLEVAANGMLGDSEETLLTRARALSARAITASAMKNRKAIVAYLVEPELEAAAVAAKRTETLDDDEVRRILINTLDDELAMLPPTVTTPVLLTTSAARRPIHDAIRTAWPRMAVVAYDELTPAANVMPIARISAPYAN